MSFSSEIKQILCKIEYECPECRRAELAGFFGFTGRIFDKEFCFGSSVKDVTERIKKSIIDEYGVIPVNQDRKLCIKCESDVQKIKSDIENVNIDKICCSTAYIRGAFLGSGSVSNPQKEYHLEFDTKSKEGADYLTELLQKRNFRPKRTLRKGKEVVYIKESSQIADIIGYMSMGRAGLEIISAQVEKELKSSIVRQVNCDSANLNKLAKASSRHIAAINKIKKARKWSSMPEVLREIGDLRLKYPDVSLESLGKMTKQTIGKSGVNHRLNRIIEFAQSIK